MNPARIRCLRKRPFRPKVVVQTHAVRHTHTHTHTREPISIGISVPIGLTYVTLSLLGFALGPNSMERKRDPITTVQSA